MRACAQSPVRTSYSPVVEALVCSAPTSPVSQYASRSGIISSVRAASGTGADSSWYTVLNGRNCSPPTS